MFKIGSLLGFLLLLQTCAFNAAPYEMADHLSHDNTTWGDLNKTVRSFNRSNLILSQFSNFKNNSSSMFDMNLENSTDYQFLNASNGDLNSDFLNNSQILNSSISLEEISLNSTAKLPIVMNSAIELQDLNASKANPLVEIMDPIMDNQTSNFDFNSTFIDGTIQFDQISHFNQSSIEFLKPIENGQIDEEQSMNISENQTGDFFPQFSSLVMNESSLFNLKSFIKLVAIDSSNDSCLISDIYVLEKSIKHSIIKYIDPKIVQLSVKLGYDPLVEQMSNIQEQLPLNMTVHIQSPNEISEIKFQSAMVEYAANTKRCVMQNQTEIRCSHFRPKDSDSLLRIADYWIELGEIIPNQEKLSGNEYEIFTYKPVWIVGLAIIGGIIAIFFLGCIVAICYTRRPYKRCGKVYEIDSATRKNNQPYIPGVHPSTKASAITKTKEMYYQ